MTKCPPRIHNLNQYNNRFGECKRIHAKLYDFLHDIVESFSSMCFACVGLSDAADSDRRPARVLLLFIKFFLQTERLLLKFAYENVLRPMLCLQLSNFCGHAATAIVAMSVGSVNALAILAQISVSSAVDDARQQFLSHALWL